MTDEIERITYWNKPSMSLEMVKSYYENEKEMGTIFGNMSLEDYIKEIEKTFDII